MPKGNEYFKIDRKLLYRTLKEANKRHYKPLKDLKMSKEQILRKSDKVMDVLNYKIMKL